MMAATDRLLAATTSDPHAAFMVVTEAVWWVTLVDATLVRYHDEVYGRLLADLDPAERQAIEDTFGGLRFVRNQMVRQTSPGNLICPPANPGAQPAQVAEWTWDSACSPDVAARPGPDLDWELTRHRSYQAQLAGRPVGGSFTRASAFLQQAWIAAAPQP
jgi:hypothetical protein